MACNTASTLSLASVREIVDIPVVGTVPAIKPAAEITQTGTIGVLATPGTIRRQYLDDLERQFAAHIKVVRHGTAGLVELAERHVRGEILSQDMFDNAISPLFSGAEGQNIDVVVLACTHFPLIRDQIQKACPAYVTKLIDSGDAIGRQVGRLLVREKSSKKSPDACVLLTGGRANRDAYFPVLEKFGYTRVETVDL